jgi:hypothetical protein
MLYLDGMVDELLASVAFFDIFFLRKSFENFCSSRWERVSEVIYAESRTPSCHVLTLCNLVVQVGRDIRSLSGINMSEDKQLRVETYGIWSTAGW